jgi:protein-arginine kinase activator protein McsA
MKDAVEALDFETAALIRDEIRLLRGESISTAKPKKRKIK